MDCKFSSELLKSFKVEFIFMHSPVSKALDGLEGYGPELGFSVFLQLFAV